MKTLNKIVLLLIASSCLAFAQKKAVIEGTINDENNNPLPYVNVFLLNSSDGSMSTENGTFMFSTSLTGRATLIASIVGYEKYSKELVLNSSRKISIHIQLNQDAIKLKETIVTASS